MTKKKTSAPKRPPALKKPPAPPKALPEPDRHGIRYGSLVHTLNDISRGEALRLIKTHGYRCMSDGGGDTVTLRGDTEARASYRAARAKKVD